MNRQDMDPLADGVPPRHAYESDDEDEFDPNPLAAVPVGPPPKRTNTVEPSLTVDLPHAVCQSGNPLLIALGPVGKAWAKGAKLGDAVGRVGLDRVGYLAILFKPSWFKGEILVADIPPKVGDRVAWALADTVARFWSNSKSVVLLDAYDAVNYRSTQRSAGQDDPIRFLGLGINSEATKLTEEFAPPNLLQGPVAAMINTFTKSALDKKSSANLLAVLVPSRDYNNARVLSRNSKWNFEVMQSAHQIVVTSLQGSQTTWTSNESDKSVRPFAFRDEDTTSKKSDSAYDMNMYI